MKFCQALIGLPAEWYVPVSVAAEAAGFDMVGLSDHVIHPESLASNYPYTPCRSCSASTPPCFPGLGCFWCWRDSPR